MDERRWILSLQGLCQWAAPRVENPTPPITPRTEATDSSNPQLQKLDNLRVTLTYDGWQADILEAEAKHGQMIVPIQKKRGENAKEA